MAQKFSHLFFLLNLSAQFSIAQLPKPDHIVVLILENHPAAQIVNNPDAPYINSLINDSYTAFFSSSYALAHPSQPNYIMFYSGENQGITDNATSVNAPFTTLNLGASLIQNAYSFATYSEDLPYEGFLGDTNLYYVRKHNPCTNWQGTQSNGIPQACNKPFSAFPTNFDSLPTISYVVPNLLNDMHNNFWLPSCVVDGDNWVQTNLDPYIQWCKTHNSLFVLTFDEDDYSGTNNITTFFTGAMVLQTIISDSINHYSLLRTFEDMYLLPNSTNTLLNNPIMNCWSLATQSAQNTDNVAFEIQSKIINNEIQINYKLNNETIVNIELIDAEGRVVFSSKEKVATSNEQLIIKKLSLDNGLYFLSIKSNDFVYANKLFYNKQ